MPANAGAIVVVPGTGRRFNDYVAQFKNGELERLAHKDLADKELDVPCSVCGADDAPKRCDFPTRKPHRFFCGRRLCEACAVHIFSRNDCDYCPAHAKEAGIRMHPLMRRPAQAMGLPNSLLYAKAGNKDEWNECVRLAREALGRQYRQQESHARDL